MKASWEKIEKNVGVLDIEVEAEQVGSALDEAFKKVVKKVNVPGFRKGKVPRQIFEAKFGVESLYQDALDILLPQAYSQAVKETGIEPVDRPEVDVEQIAKGQTLKFKAKVVVKPEVELGEYKGLSYASKPVEVTEEEVAEELNRLQQRHAELTVVEDGVAEQGDTAIIDFEGSVDGVLFDGGKSENHSLELGSGSFIPGFEEQVVGMCIAEEKDIHVTFPEEYHSEDLKGKAAVFKVKLNDLKRKKLPELDNDFALDVSEFDTLDEFKQDIAKKLQESKEQTAQREKENNLVEQAVAAAEVEIPEAMIDFEAEQTVRDFEQRLQRQGMNLELYLQYTGQTEDALKEQYKGDAAKRVRNNLVLEAIAKAEGIEASEEQLLEELDRLSKQYQRTVEELRSIFEANGHLDSIKNDLAIQKTVQFLVEHSVQAEA